MLRMLAAWEWVAQVWQGHLLHTQWLTIYSIEQYTLL